MNRLLIVGAGNFGREVMDWALAVPPEKRDWELEGFLDNRADVVESLDAPYPVLGDPDTFEFTERHRLICAVGESAARLEYGRRLRGRGARFITLIHPTATIGSNCSWGVGCIFCPGTVITNHVTLGDFVVLNCYATVGHDAVLGDGCTLSGHAVVTGWAVLGEGVFMGTHASVLPKARVGDHALIGAGSVVIKNALPRTTVMGVPARKIFRGKSHG